MCKEKNNEGNSALEIWTNSTWISCPEFYLAICILVYGGHLLFMAIVRPLSGVEGSLMSFIQMLVTILFSYNYTRRSAQRDFQVERDKVVDSAFRRVRDIYHSLKDMITLVDKKKKAKIDADAILEILEFSISSMIRQVQSSAEDWGALSSEDQNIIDNAKATYSKEVDEPRKEQFDMMDQVQKAMRG